MDAKDSAANVGVSGAWEEIKQGLSGGDHKQQHRENQADSRASLRAAAAQLLHQASNNRTLPRVRASKVGREFPDR